MLASAHGSFAPPGTPSGPGVALRFHARAYRILAALLDSAAAGKLRRDETSTWGLAWEAFEFEFAGAAASGETRSRIEAVAAEIAAGKLQVE
jgi:hypothetical protein